MSPLTEPTRIVLKNYNAPAAIAGVAPTLDYRFALDRRELDAVSLTDKLTVTRAATAAVNGPTGYLELAGPNVARFDHNLTTHQSLGLLVEGSRTNLVTASSDIAGYFTEQNSTETANALTAPDGTTTADLIVPNTTLITHASYKSSLSFTSNATYSYSIFVKPNGYNWLQLLFTSGFGNSAAWVNFNLTGAGSFGFTGGGELSKSIQAYPNGWYRCTITATSGSSVFAGGPAFIALDSDRNARDANYAGNNTSGIYFWGAQLEEGSSPTSYIPTTGSTVTRTESATIDGTGVITGTYTMVEKPAGCAVVNGTNIDLQTGYTAERVMVFPAALSSEQITAIRSVM